MLKGKTETATSWHDVGHHDGRIYELFFQKFGSPCCRNLNFNEFDNRDHYVRCHKIVGGTAQLLFDYLGTSGLLPEEDSGLKKR
jgi:hypothetical protein